MDNTNLTRSSGTIPRRTVSTKMMSMSRVLSTATKRQKVETSTAYVSKQWETLPSRRQGTVENALPDQLKAQIMLRTVQKVGHRLAGSRAVTLWLEHCVVDWTQKWADGNSFNGRQNVQNVL